MHEPLGKPKAESCRAAFSKARMLGAGCPLDLAQPETLRWKLQEPVLLLGKQRFANVDIRLRVKGGGHVSQVYGKHTAYHTDAELCSQTFLLDLGQMTCPTCSMCDFQIRTSDMYDLSASQVQLSAGRKRALPNLHQQPACSS